jgi:hypothetical protein
MFVKASTDKTEVYFESLAIGYHMRGRMSAHMAFQYAAYAVYPNTAEATRVFTSLFDDVIA